MRFEVIPMRMSIPYDSDGGCLVQNRWDDYGYKTTFNFHYRRHGDHPIHIGRIKIGQFDMVAEQSRPEIPPEFDNLDERFFSLGQDDSYYERLNRLGDETRDLILRSLNDVAADLELFTRALTEPVTGRSLLRDVSKSTVQNQYHRMTQGGARLSPFRFSYIYPSQNEIDQRPLELSFSVLPESQPPSNVHVIIGRNGVGKSRLLNNIAYVLLGLESEQPTGDIEFESQRGKASEQFANLISVAFSAFDDFEPLSTPQDRSKGLQYTYIGLKKKVRVTTDEPTPPKDSRALATEFGSSVKACLQTARLERWRRALEMLESDPIFADVRVADLAEAMTDDDPLRSRARDLFRNLSSGHKIVLLTITRLVESIEERSLVLLDEPESHLHPPLLAAFVRALSDLLIYRNGVAIIATHSPVVLQEVPKHCVWKLRRSGRTVAADRPQIETFGENVGILTQEVFGLEVTNSGFHRMITEAVQANYSYDSVLASFDGRLGAEGKALAQALLAAHHSENW